MGPVEDDPEFRPDRYYIVSDAGSVYFDDDHPDGFGSPAEAAEWARTQTLWAYGEDLDLSDGVSAAIVLGREVNECLAAWEAWDGRGDWPDAPGVHNYAINLGLVEAEDAE